MDAPRTRLPTSRVPRPRATLCRWSLAVFAVAVPTTGQAGRPVIPTTVSSPEVEEPAGAVPRCQPERAAKVRVLLLDLEAVEGDARLGRTLGQVVAEEASRVEGFELLSTDELRALLDNESQKAFAGCDDAGCLADLASALDADLLISGTFDRTTGAAPTITLSLLNTRALVTVNRVTMAWPGDAALLPEVARAAAQRLVLEGKQRRPGRLVIEGLPQDAKVFLGEQELSARLDRGVVDELDVGPYHVRLAAPGFEPREQDLLIRADKDTVIDGVLAPEAEGSSWWWVGAVAGAATVALVGGVLTVAALTGTSAVSANAQVEVPTLGDVEAAKP